MRALPHRQVHTPAQLRDVGCLRHPELPGEDVARQRLGDQLGVGLRRSGGSRRDATRVPAEEAQSGNQAGRGHRPRFRYVVNTTICVTLRTRRPADTHRKNPKISLHPFRYSSFFNISIRYLSYLKRSFSHPTIQLYKFYHSTIHDQIEIATHMFCLKFIELFLRYQFALSGIDYFSDKRLRAMN